MDLEHHDLGEHCSMPGCNQKDFLPFTCDVCSRKLCLQHRSYLNHQCSGVGSKNITSIACPICEKTIKFNKTENIDMLWENHYLNECTKKAAKPIDPKTCPMCNIKMGLTNLFHCKLCNTDLCLSHRSPDDHNCVKNTKRKNNFENKSVTFSSDPTNRKEQEQYSCPFCDRQFPSTDTLNIHVNSAHVDNPTPNTGTNGSESCPICNLRFQDPVELVNHFERVHNNIPSNSHPPPSEPTCRIQ